MRAQTEGENMSRHPKLKEITLEEIQKNIENYYNTRQEFFIKVKHHKGLQSCCLYRFEDYDEDDNYKTIWIYRLQYDSGDLEYLDDPYIQHYYMLK